MNKGFALAAILPGLLFCCGEAGADAQQDARTIAWIQNDIEGLRFLLRQMPLELQDTASLGTRFEKTGRIEREASKKGYSHGIARGWTVTERKLGFGATQLELSSGHEGCGSRAQLLTFEHQVAHYEIEVRCHERWPALRQAFVDEWRRSAGVEFAESAEGLNYQKELPQVMGRYRRTVASGLGELKVVEIPAALQDGYNLLISPLTNSVVSTNGCGMAASPLPEMRAIKAIVASGRLDLVENILKGYNPGGRIYAVMALLTVKQTSGLSLETEAALEKVLDLDAAISTCSGCMGEAAPNARAALEMLRRRLDGTRRESFLAESG